MADRRTASAAGESGPEPSYRAISRIGHGEYEEKKSRFLAEAIPVRTQEEAEEHLRRIRKAYYDARHHCYAWVLGAQCDRRRSSDDGEPSGTAGAPILRVIDTEGCTDLLIAVTRYFGGTLLGTGGLVRAYTEASKRALSDARPVRMAEGELLELTLDYSLLAQVQHYLKTENIEPAGMDYAELVTCRILVPSRRVPDVCARMQVLSGGRMTVTAREKGFYAFDDRT